MSRPYATLAQFQASRRAGLTWAQVAVRFGYASRFNAQAAAIRQGLVAGVERSTPAERRRALALHRRGLHDTEIALRLYRSHEAVSCWRRAAGLPAHPPRLKYPRDAPCRHGCGRTRGVTAECNTCERRRQRNGACADCGAPLRHRGWRGALYCPRCGEGGGA